MVSKEEEDFGTRAGERRDVVREDDQPELSQDPGVELEGGKRDPGDRGQSGQLGGDGPAPWFREVLEDEALVLVECFR